MAVPGGRHAGLWPVVSGIGRLSPVAVSAMSLLSPVTAVVLGWIFLGQKIQDGADGIDRGAGERDVYPARAGASGGGSKNEKAP